MGWTRGFSAYVCTVRGDMRINHVVFCSFIAFLFSITNFLQVLVGCRDYFTVHLYFREYRFMNELISENRMT